MTIDCTLKIRVGILSVGLLISLLCKLTHVPGDMILSGLFLGEMLLVGIILDCLILTALLKLVFKKTSFLIILFITTSISFLAFHYQLYSPALIIKVPNGYKGEIHLVLSNVSENILTVDSNGIGYINEWTFNKTYSRPIVEEIDGKNLNKNLVGFNPSTFFGKSIDDGNAIRSLSFKIVPDIQKEDKFYTNDWVNKVDRKLILLKNPAKGINNKAIEVKIVK